MAERQYHRDMEAALQGFAERRPRLLLHVCCAPCASAALEALMPRAELTLLYYNPNIRPVAEYEKRLEALKRLLAATDGAGGIPLLAFGYDAAAFDAAAAGLLNEPEGGARCDACFRLRLRYTARLAAAGNFDFFCTTLTVSPHKNAVHINTVGEEQAAICGVPWLPSDFKKRDGYRRSVALSVRYGLYRQIYCGCLPPGEML